MLLHPAVLVRDWVRSRWKRSIGLTHTQYNTMVWAHRRMPALSWASALAAAAPHAAAALIAAAAAEPAKRAPPTAPAVTAAAVAAAEAAAPRRAAALVAPAGRRRAPASRPWASVSASCCIGWRTGGRWHRCPRRRPASRRTRSTPLPAARACLLVGRPRRTPGRRRQRRWRWRRRRRACGGKEGDGGKRA